MVKDGKGNYEHGAYEIMVVKQIDITKIVILILLVIAVIGLTLIAKDSIKLINQHKVYEQYEAQLISLQKQEEDKQAEMEAKQEKIRQERIPQLTEERKKQYEKHLSFRNQKSISYF